jgi:hypothetical protein
MLNRDPWLENNTTGAGRRHRYLHGPEGNNFYTGTDGIVSNAILSDRTVGYFPRRGVMVL